MGTFYTSCRLENPMDRKRTVQVSRLLVDSGSEFTWVDAETLKKIGVKRERKDYTFVMANGQQITRSIGFAIIHVSDAVTVDEVVFAEAGDLQLLGARSLEWLNLRVDGRAKKLVAGGPILAASDLTIISGDSMGEAAQKAVSEAGR
jgi:predicted aspartyl protease